jgi:hypothetical protein
MGTTTLGVGRFPIGAFDRLERTRVRLVEKAEKSQQCRMLAPRARLRRFALWN